jgi:hypothetical protein
VKRFSSRARKIWRAWIASLVSGLALAACGSSGSSSSSTPDPGCGLLAQCPAIALEVRLCPERIVNTRCTQSYEEYLRCYAEHSCSGDASAESSSTPDGGDPCTGAAQQYQYCRSGIDAGG